MERQLSKVTAAMERVMGSLPMPLTLLVSPTGTCMLDVPSIMAAPDIQLDPLTCEVKSPL